MFFASYFLVLLQATMFSSVLSVAVTDFERRAAVDTPESTTVTVGDHQIHVATVRVNTTSSFIPSGTSFSTTSLTKRVTINACQYGCSESCADGLSTSPDPPLEADCTALAAALKALAQTEVTATGPCRFPNLPNCPNFTVAPGFERQYTLGTCLVGFVNLFAAGGSSLSFCDFLLAPTKAGTMPGMFSDCIVTAGTTGAICAQVTDPNALYALEVRHI